MNTSQLTRLFYFAEEHPELVRGATRVNFAKGGIEVLWGKWLHTREELQAVARRHKHLEWTVVRSDTTSRNLDWLCDFGEIVVRLQHADVEDVAPIPAKVNFEEKT